MSAKIRVVLYMDATAWNANRNEWFANAQPPSYSPSPGSRRYQIVVEIPDPRAADEVVRGEVTEVGVAAEKGAR